eukprot:372755-Pelagomonas_calceolata.AAC.1
MMPFTRRHSQFNGQMQRSCLPGARSSPCTSQHPKSPCSYSTQYLLPACHGALFLPACHSA